MPLTQKGCEAVLAEMTPQRQAQFLTRLGHMYTVYARDAYEFQGPGVTNPRLLRDFNEVHHRIYAQLTGLLMDGKDVFPPDILAVWLCGEGRDDAFRVVSLEVFERCLKNFNAS
jgi:hypothetical protein